MFGIGCRLVRTRPHFHMRKSRRSEVIRSSLSRGQVEPVSLVRLVPHRENPVVLATTSDGLALAIFLAPHGCLWGCGVDQRCGVRTVEDTVMNFVPLTTLCPYVKRQCTAVCLHFIKDQFPTRCSKMRRRGQHPYHRKSYTTI